MAVQTAPAPVTAPEVATANKLTMIVFSGEMDRLVAAFHIATGAAASGVGGEMRQLAIDLGVKMLACQMSMDVMEVDRADLIDQVSDVAGVAAMLEVAT